MLRSLGVAVALALSALAFLLPAHADDRTLSMRFDLRQQGPAEACGATCQTWISAHGIITADSARDFLLLAHEHDLTGATIALDSAGGSVLGAIALGREIRRLGLTTTVGRSVAVNGKDDNTQREVLSPRADCESMCAFVLLGGVQRIVPPEARVMVHQIWLGDRRDDPTAANYSAEDLALVQRDIGRLAQYTADMGASNDLLDLTLRIPPWEPLHSLTRAEIRRTRLATGEAVEPRPAAVAVSPPALVARPARPVTDGIHAAAISERRWTMVERAGVASLTRRHPLTVEGEDIGNFDLVVACGAGPDSFDLSYIERRHGTGGTSPVARLIDVNLRAGRSRAVLKVTSSERRDRAGELASLATGAVPAAMIRAFAGPGSHSMVIETRSKGMATIIRLGNTGTQKNVPRLAASCARSFADRAAAVHKTGGMAAAR